METTGTGPAKSRIAKIAILRIEPTGVTTNYIRRLNPGKVAGLTSSRAAIEVHPHHRAKLPRRDVVFPWLSRSSGNQCDARGLLRELTWTHNLLIQSACKRPEQREFYLRLAIRERWDTRELERQLKSALFERTVLAPPKLSAVLRELQPSAETIFKDAYLLDFLDLPTGHSEAELQAALKCFTIPFLAAEFERVGARTCFRDCNLIEM